MVINTQLKAALKETKPDEITADGMFKKVDEYLRTIEGLAEAFSHLEYALGERHDNSFSVLVSSGKEIYEAQAIVNAGGSEGIYIDCYIYAENIEAVNEKYHIGTYKTLNEDMTAYIEMGMIAGAFTNAGNIYLSLNL